MSSIWDKFFTERSKPLSERFPGRYRAMVVETNDPLNMYRIRFKCPELHNYNLRADECPWAVPSPELGGPRTGSWSHPCIGDQIWISFEKQHPYGPIWTGFANPTRTKQYTYAQIYNISQVPVNSDGNKTEKPDDYDDEYLPSDGRPMSTGIQDRYGNLDILSAIGFFPTSHNITQSPLGVDPLTNEKFKSNSKAPKQNKPDKKYMARVSKYGNLMLLSDVGYIWKSNGSQGEFVGDAVKDEKFESKRWKYIQRLLNEDDHGNGSDQRRIQLQTRYKHLFEARDVGWNKTREGEYGPSVTISESNNDYRWIKMRTGGGHLFQAYDKGSDPENDVIIKKSALDSCGIKLEKEDIHWKDKDARFMRLVSRYGYKFVIDDRGSDTRDATGKESPRGNGILIKGRRSPASKAAIKNGDARGFFWEFNENDKANHTTWGSPLGQTIEINDRYQYLLIASSLGKGWSTKWRGIEENEFIRKPAMNANPELTSHHIKLDHDNEYIRIKTRSGNGQTPDRPAEKPGLTKALNQGFEARDGASGDGPWLELVDSEHRGIWFSNINKLGIWRARKNKQMYHILNENNDSIIIYNNQETGSIDIFCAGNINLISGNNINLNAKNNINFKSGNLINMQAQNTYLTVSTRIQSNVVVEGLEFRDIPGGNPVQNVISPQLPIKIEPDDRGATYNSPFEECPIAEVEHTDIT